MTDHESMDHEPLDAGDPDVSTFEWTPPTAAGRPDSFGPRPEGEEPVRLRDRLTPVVENRGMSSADLVRRVARSIGDWVKEPERVEVGLADTLRDELRDVEEGHGWRGTVARFLDAVDARSIDALAADCEAWLQTPEAARAEGTTPRLPDRSRCAVPLLASGPDDEILDTRIVGPNETILVHGWSETVARGLELAHARGLAPRVVVSEGGPDLGGRRLARRLAADGLVVTFVYDAALTGAVQRVDRIWLGTESIGEHTFLGRVGTRAMLEHAKACDVPAMVLATTDKMLPKGDAQPPAWAADEPWHLWEGAPSLVDVESQSFEAVAHDLVEGFATEGGVIGSGAIAARVAGDAPLPVAVRS